MKKKKLVALFVVLYVIFVGVTGLVGCGNSSDVAIDSAAENKEENVSTLPEEDETTTNESVVIDTEESSQKDNRYFVGDSFTVGSAFDDGTVIPLLDVNITGTGIVPDPINSKNTLAYVELDIENICDEYIELNGYFGGFFGDDYMLDFTPSGYIDDSLAGKMVAPGRKVKGAYYAIIPDSGVNIVEANFSNCIIVIKDTSLVNSDEMSVPENADTSELTYGTYVYHDTTLGNINTAEVGFASGEGANYIYIDCRGEGGHGVIEFVGYFQEANEDNSYTAIQSPEDYFDAEVRCTFVDGGLNVEVVSSEFDTLYDAAGYYELESELNLDEVG